MTDEEIEAAYRKMQKRRELSNALRGVLSGSQTVHIRWTPDCSPSDWSGFDIPLSFIRDGISRYFEEQMEALK
jgi:hypothetical protein